MTGAVLVDIGSIPTDHSLTHIPPLPVSNMRQLALETDDPLRVNTWLNDTQFSIHEVCGTMEWMGQTTQVHHARGARSLHAVPETTCDFYPKNPNNPSKMAIIRPKTADSRG